MWLALNRIHYTKHLAQWLAYSILKSIKIILFLIIVIPGKSIWTVLSAGEGILEEVIWGIGREQYTLVVNTISVDTFFYYLLAV